jgi:hypothetical protein
VQQKELLKTDSSSAPADTEGVSSRPEDERERPTSFDQSAPGLLLAQKPASAINRMGATSHVARTPASSMNDVVVAERGPELAEEQASFKLNPYTDILNRARVKSTHSPHSSISVPADGMPQFEQQDNGKTEPHDIGVPNSKKMLRSAPDDTSTSESGWSRTVAASIMAVLVAGVGLATRKKVATKEFDIEGGASHETTPLLTTTEVAAPTPGGTPGGAPGDAAGGAPAGASEGFSENAKDTYHPKNAATTRASQLVAEAQVPLPQTIFVSDPVVVRRAEEEESTEEQKDNVLNDVDRKEAADAIRKWMKMLRKNRRAGRHKRLRYLEKMRKLRLQRLKAARLQMKRKMQAEFGDHGLGLEKRISKEKDATMTPPRDYQGKDPHRVVSMMMRLLRLLLRSKRKVRERTTTKTRGGLR